MQQRKILVSILILIAAGALGSRLFKAPEKLASDKGSELKTAEVRSSHSAQFLKPEFYSGIRKPETVEPFDHLVSAAVVSHHFYVERLIAKFFARIRSDQIKTVVLVGPNHFNQGTARFITSAQDFMTPWGTLESDLELRKKLENTGLVISDEQPFETEHSISALVGFIKYYFPQAKILPIIVRRSVSPEDAKKLGQVLHKNTGADTLVLASVDFSHHLGLEQTERNDKKSEEALKSFQVEKFWDIQADSPASLSVAFSFATERGAGKLEYTNTNSARYSGELSSSDITSYFFGYLYK
jgi:AmmeMemoRadiSam system protein B